jgi:hypothetical protein
MQTLAGLDSTSAFALRTLRTSHELPVKPSLAGTSQVVSFVGGLPKPRTLPVAVTAWPAEAIIDSGDAASLRQSRAAGLPEPRAAAVVEAIQPGVFECDAAAKLHNPNRLVKSGGHIVASLPGRNCPTAGRSPRELDQEAWSALQVAC